MVVDLLLDDEDDAEPVDDSVYSPVVSGDPRSDIDLPVRPDDNDVHELLSLSPATLMQQASRVHGIMIRWATYTSDCKKHYQIVKLARDTRLAEAKEEARRYLSAHECSTAVAAVDARATRDELYQEIARDVISAEAEWEKARGVVNAVFTKRDMIKSLLYSMGDAAKLAVEQNSPDGMDYGVNPDDGDVNY